MKAFVKASLQGWKDTIANPAGGRRHRRRSTSRASMPTWCFQEIVIVNALVATPEARGQGARHHRRQADGGERRSDRQGHRRRRQGRGEGRLRHQRAAAAADQAVTDGSGVRRSRSRRQEFRRPLARGRRHRRAWKTSPTSFQAGRARLAARPERLRQDHAVADRRRHDAGEPGPGRNPRPRGRWARRRISASCSRRRTCCRGGRCWPMCCSRWRSRGATTRRRESARWSCSIWSGSPASQTAGRTSSPAA